ncbi:MAG TPA: MarR family winged helix-turn-helix transcriptional regulator [Polyangiaceae bacterium]|nr:MarR family winged helix-turn-helix transcriptional regulator [Polyangiaceae bacterium]
MSTFDPRDFEALKRQSVAQLLFKCARLVNERAIERVNQQVGPEPALRASHTALFPHLTSEGVRGADLAKKLGVTKQAVSQLVAELEYWGVVEQVDDPKDGRAKLVRFTPKGEQGLLQGMAVLRELEQELGDKIGKRRMQELHTALLALEEALT